MNDLSLNTSDPSAHMNETWIKVIFESKLLSLPLLRKAIRGICSCIITNEQILQDIDLCINEAVSNVIYHAYQNEPGHEIQVSVSLSDKEVIFQIIDIGLSKTDSHQPVTPEILSDNIENLAESGRGLFLIHELMDEVIYKSEKGKNTLILRKCFNSNCKQ